MMQASASRSNKAIEKPKVHQSQRKLKRKREDEDIAALEGRIRNFDTTSQVTTFEELPLSQATRSGLSKSHFKTLTTIQQQAIALALKGSDILAAAKTGSGKTLAFLVPVLEKLVHKRWTEYDGLGAVIVSPTRELAIQIFDVLRKVGQFHMFSAGLVIGGKSVQEEQERLGRMNILVCTPGRMLQHLDQTSTFETQNLQILVLDEADMIMDMGFQTTVDAIIEHLKGRERQTLLFSATQTKKISDLARLSLNNPAYIAVHETAASATPETLKQHYVVTPLPDKLDVLWSFLRANVKSKILVFLSSGKQVRFVYESFRHLQPGIPLLHLHGRQKQSARMDITSRFAAAKHVCLFSTDVAARGLDFPTVEWVISVDCPQDADTYVHRVGRTARYGRDGRAVLLLQPSEEEAMVERLKHKKIPIEEIKVRERKQESIKGQLQNMCFKDPELKYLGQKAFIAYVKSINIQKDKDVFDVRKLPLEEYAASLGLPGSPRIKFQRGDDSKRLKNAPRQMLASSNDEEDNVQPVVKAVRTKYDRMFERQNQDILSTHYANLIDHEKLEERDLDGNIDDDGAFLTTKRHFWPDPSGSPPEASNSPPPPQQQAKRFIQLPGREPIPLDSKRREKLLKSKKQLLKYQSKGSKLIFDDEGNPHAVYEMKDEEDFKLAGAATDQRQRFIDEEQERVLAADAIDKALAKEKRKARRAKQKEREKEARGKEDTQVVLAPYEEDEGVEQSNLRRESYDESSSELDNEILKGKAKRRKNGSSPAKETPYQETLDLEEEKPGKLEDLEALAASYL